MSTPNTIGTAHDVNSDPEGGVWFGPSRTVHGVTISTFWEPTEGFYFYVNSPGRALDVPQTRDLIAALSSMLRAVGE